MSCTLCPRHCPARPGFCRTEGAARVARAMLHEWEEPCISGTRGSGAVFFSGCTMRCVYCQNYAISHDNFGKNLTDEQLAALFLSLQSRGAHNINLVTPTHHLPAIVRALDGVGSRLHIPIVYNCGGYESVETIRALGARIQVYLTDLKYFDVALAVRYSAAPHYFETAMAALRAMTAETGAPQFDGSGLLTRGTIVRHMVLPGCRHDSIEILRRLADLPRGSFLLSLMSQYTPQSGVPPELARHVTSFEYQSVVDEAVRLGLTDGFMQDRASAQSCYTPPFDLTGLPE